MNFELAQKQRDYAAGMIREAKQFRAHGRFDDARWARRNAQTWLTLARISSGAKFNLTTRTWEVQS